MSRVKIAKRIGWLLILLSIISIASLILYSDFMPKVLFIFLVLFSSVFLAFGAALIPMLLESNKRRKYKRVYLIVSISFAIAGFLSKTFHFPGAAIEMIIGVLWYCFAFAPLELKDKYLKWLPFSKSKWETVLLSMVDFIGLNMVLLGVLFKIMWWPFANILMVSGGAIVLAGLISWNQKFKREVVRRKQSEDKIKEQFEEIHDSIKYAKRIQTAILPPNRLVKEYLPQSFILYKPKDIVAGDFYWMETIKRGTEDVVLFAAADCTGHGVPGAMVSVVCNNGLNRSVREYGLIEPGKILDKTREIVIQEFEKSDEEVKDGMDISLCSLSLTSRKLLWAGANNPLWIIRAGANEVEEIKPNKQPIGKYTEPKPFTTHEILLNLGDTICVFTDGYQDQFGGEKGKKFKAAKMKEYLLSIQRETMEKQRELIDQTFEHWKGTLEQIDDVCVIGVRL